MSIKAVVLGARSTDKPNDNEKKASSSSPSPVCHVDNSLAARDQWLEGGAGYILIHHVRRAGGTTMCGILSPLMLKSNCILAGNGVVGNGMDRYSLKRFRSVSMLEKEMEKQGTKVVSIEGYELPKWFLNDPERSKRWTIVTSIRDPVDRLVSYSRVKCPENPQRCWSAQVDNPTKYPLNNVFTRMFAGGATPGGLGNPHQTVTEDHLATAIRLLETEYQIILITEWIPEMTPIFKYWFGIEDATGFQRRGHSGNHSTEASILGRENAVLHYVPESSAQYYLEKHNHTEAVYNKMVADNLFDLRLLEHFRERERQRVVNCFLFRSSNIPNGLSNVHSLKS